MLRPWFAAFESDDVICMYVSDQRTPIENAAAADDDETKGGLGAGVNAPPIFREVINQILINIKIERQFLQSLLSGRVLDCRGCGKYSKHHM